MTTTKLQVLTTATVLALGTLAANADTVSLSQNGNYSYDNGGEFTAYGSPTLVNSHYAASTIVNGGIETFCDQVNTEFNPGTTYSYKFSQTSDPVSPSGVLTKGAAYLYSQFAAGTLAGYNYTPGAGRIASSGELQAALWYLQGKQIGDSAFNSFGFSASGYAGTGHDKFYDLVVAAFGSHVTDASNGAYGVAIMQLHDLSAPYAPAQNQFVAIPDAGSSVLMLGMGLTGLVLARRNKVQA